jgi:holin-like protein
VLNALTILLVCQFAGEIISNATGLPVPGPVLGLVFLLLLQVVRKGKVARELKSTAQALLQNLSLLFVPAGVGVIDHLDVLARNWLPLALSIAISTLLGLGVTAWIMQRLSRTPIRP